MAVVNYIDEYLTTNNKIPENSNIHKKIGGLLLISTLFSSFGALFLFILSRGILISQLSMIIGFFSAIPMVIMFATYFYLLIRYPAYQVVPLFLLSSLWLLILELLFGGSITLIGFLGIVSLLLGAYFLDAGTLKWQIPTKLLLIMLPATSAWAITLFMVRVASSNSSAIGVSFWQLIGVTTIGFLLLILVKSYRDGFIYRLKHQGKKFVGLSLVNESLSQGSFVFAYMAIAIVPVASYVTSLSGLQSVFLLTLFYFFPIHKDRAKITKIQVFSILLIAFGVFLIERSVL